MAYSSDQLDALRSAMAEGVQSVQFADGRRVVFRDLAEMQQLERVMVGDLGAAAVAAGQLFFLAVADGSTRATPSQSRAAAA